MKFESLLLPALAGIYAIFAASGVSAGTSRTPVTGVPTIQGRAIEQFVLVAYVHMNTSVNAGVAASSAFMMLPGQFVAVSEDGGGVYYQATKGFRLAHDPSIEVPGGVYVRRTGSSSMTAYFGDARDPRAPLKLLNHRPMIVEDMKKFQVAKSTSAKPPKK